MATYTFDGTQSLRIENFDVAADRLVVDFTADEVVAVENVQGSATLTTASGAVLIVAGLTYADLAEAQVLPADLLIIGSDDAQRPEESSNDVLDGALVAALAGSVVVANGGADSVIGLTGDDLLLGNEGDDSILGGGGNDRVYGGRGDDLILVGQEFDGDVDAALEDGLETSRGVELLVAGGLGEDVIVVGGGSLTSVEGDDGLVRGDVTVYGGDAGVDAADEADQILVGLAEDATALIAGNGGDDEIEIVGEGVATVFGGLGDDTIDVQARAATVYGGLGDDAIFAEVETGEFYGNVGEDTISVFASEGVTVYGGQDDDVIDADFAEDSLIFGNLGGDEIALNTREAGFADIGAATVYGGQGEDTITGFLGDGSLVYGGEGGDEIDVTILEGDVTVIGGNGGDNAGDAGDAIAVTLGNGGDQSAFVAGNLGDDDIVLGGTGEFVVYGGQGDDTIATGEGALGDDSAVYGGQGEDTLDLAVSGDDVSIYGGTGLGDTTDAADTITVDVAEGVEDLAIYGNGGDDTIVLTGGGEVSVFGGVGDDTIGFGEGATGDYTLTGGAGADLFDLSDATGEALIDIDISLVDEGDEGGATIRIADFNADEDTIAVGDNTLLDLDVLDLLNVTVDDGNLVDGLVDVVGDVLGAVAGTLDGTLDAVFSLAAANSGNSDNLAVTFEFEGQQYLAFGGVGEADSTGIVGGLLGTVGDLLEELGVEIDLLDANVTALINITGYTGTIDADTFVA